MSKKRAFNLAEVLIVIGIIGIIAQSTIPSLIKSYEKDVTVKKYKKVYSELAQMLQTAEVTNGKIESWEFDDTSAFSNDIVYPNLQIIKKCETVSTQCWKAPKSITGQTGYLTNDYDIKDGVITKSGYSLYYWVGGTVSGNTRHIQIWTDIDGPDKGPAQLGKDVFGFIVRLQTSSVVQKTGLFAVGLDTIPLLTREELKNDATNGCSKQITANIYSGRFCGAMITVDSYKIADDYPW